VGEYSNSRVVLKSALGTIRYTAFQSIAGLITGFLNLAELSLQD